MVFRILEYVCVYVRLSGSVNVLGFIYIYIYKEDEPRPLDCIFIWIFPLAEGPIEPSASPPPPPPPRSRLFLFCCLCDYADEHANIRLLLIRIATPSSPRLCCRLISPLYCPSTHTHTRTHQQRPPTPCLTIAPAKTLSITTESTVLAFVIIIQSDVSSQWFFPKDKPRPLLDSSSLYPSGCLFFQNTTYHGAKGTRLPERYKVSPSNEPQNEKVDPK